MIQLYDRVTLRVDLPDEGLNAGNVGYVVEIYDEDVYEVEFSEEDGMTRAMVVLNSVQLMPDPLGPE